MRGWELRKGIENALHKITSALKLRPVTLRWANIPTACIDSRGVITLSDIADDAVVNKQVFMRYLGFIVHELLHRKYTTDGLDYSSHYVRMLWNGLEDARIENTAIAEALTGNIAEVLNALADSMVAEGMTHVTDWYNPAQLPFVIAIYMRDGVKRKVPVHPTVLPIFKEAKVRLNTCKNSAQVRDLAQWVYEQITKAVEDQPEDQPDTPTPSEPSKPTDGGSGSGTSPDDADSEGEGEGTGEGEGEGEGGGDNPAPMGMPDPDDAVCPEPTLDREKGIGGGVSWSPDQSIAPDRAHIDESCSPHAKAWDLKPVGGAKLRYEVRRLFEMSGIDEYQFNRRHGQLDAGNLHTIAAGNDRVFKRHHEEGGIDSAVVFIMDCSGSMFDTNMRAAAPVMATMLDTLDRAGVATSVITFGTQVSMLKPWNMTKAKAMPLIARMTSGADNSDSQALRYAHGLLLNRSEQRKVVFILADGGVDRDEQRRCKQQSKSGERLGITTIGVGIHADLSGMYPNNIVIKKLDDLAGASFKQIKLAA
jgi:cobalamin biosynthesis protein CobT